MTFDPVKIAQSKRELRQRLAARPIEEKLAMLDALRGRAIALRESRSPAESGTLRKNAHRLSGAISKAG
jgi:hypothetical protein